MRKIALITVLMSFSVYVKAQKLSVGYKTGLNNWLRLNTTRKGAFIIENKDGNRVSWNNEVSIRYQTKGKLVYEGGINYAKRNTDGITYIIPFEGKGWKEESINANCTEISLGV